MCTFSNINLKINFHPFAFVFSVCQNMWVKITETTDKICRIGTDL